MGIISVLWEKGIVEPMVNMLVLLNQLLFSNFGLAIIAFTILTRVVLYPLTAKQLRSTRAMSQLAPRQKAIQEKFKGDPKRLQQEQMALFKEAGVSPLGCLGPTLLQLPIFFGMFYALRNTLADTPEKLVDLSRQLYSWLPGVDRAIPLNSNFFGIDLGRTPQQTGGVLLVLMPVLVGATMYVTQKQITTQTNDPRQQTTQMMNWMMPLMFGFFTINFPNGLAIYWVITNVVSFGMQYRVLGWGGLKPQPKLAMPASTVVVDQPASSSEPRNRGRAAIQAPPPALPRPQAPIPSPFKSPGAFLKRIFLGGSSAPTAPPPAPPESPVVKAEDTAAQDSQEKDANGRAGNERKDGRRSYRQGGPSTRRRPRRRRGSGPR